MGVGAIAQNSGMRQTKGAAASVVKRIGPELKKYASLTKDEQHRLVQATRLGNASDKALAASIGVGALGVGSAILGQKARFLRGRNTLRKGLRKTGAVLAGSGLVGLGASGIVKGVAQGQRDLVTSDIGRRIHANYGLADTLAKLPQLARHPRIQAAAAAFAGAGTAALVDSQRDLLDKADTLIPKNEEELMKSPVVQNLLSKYMPRSIPGKEMLDKVVSLPMPHQTSYGVVGGTWRGIKGTGRFIKRHPKIAKTTAIAGTTLGIKEGVVDPALDEAALRRVQGMYSLNNC
jgi:hypothetical protein